MTAPNVARGEVALTLTDAQGKEINGVICCEMERFASLSAALGTKTLSELYQRVAGAEPLAMYRVVELLTVSENAAELRAAITTPADFRTIADAALASLDEIFKSQPGKSKGEAAKA